MATNADLENERKRELKRLIAEQQKDMKSRRVLPEWVSGNANFVFSVDPELLEQMEDNGMVYDSYHGWTKEDVV